MKIIASSNATRKYPKSTFTHDNLKEVPQMNPPFLAYALWYAQHGYCVLPLVPGGKLPKTHNGVKDATRDLDVIRRWWRAWPNANIGIAAGKSGLIILDFDTDEGAPLPASIGADENTIITHTAHGGMHLWYRMKAGERLGNGTGDLPAHIDVRGHGGYVVAPPSILADGLKYAFVSGHSPKDLEIAQLPAHILAWLQKSPASAQRGAITFTGHCTGKPDLGQWRLSQRVIGLIVDGSKGDRSADSQKVCVALVAAGASPDDVRAVMVHYAIGEKYREKGNGDRWLALGLGKISLAPVDPIVDPLAADLPALRDWVAFGDCVTALQKEGIRRPDDVREALRVIVAKAMARRVTKVEMSSRQLAETLCRPHMAAWRYLRRLVQIGWLTVASDQDGYAKVFDLSGLITRVKNERLLSVTPSHSRGDPGSGISGSPEGGGCNTTQSFVFDHLADEAFYPYPLRFAAKLRPNVDDILPRGLNAGARSVAGILVERGDLPQPEIASLTGYSKWKVGSLLRRMASMGLLFIQKVGRHNLYSLHPNFEERLDDLRPRLPSYGQGHMLAAKSAGARAKFLTTQLEHCDPSERVRLEARRDAYRAQKENHRQAAIAMGLDVDAKLAPPRRNVDGPEPMWRLRLRAKAHEGDDAWARQMAVDLRVAHRRTLPIAPALPMGTLPLPMAI